tara:strand:+ start:2091 stop:2966 length:876 start_codon:yes stop_codon:yes gene_type:complete
MKIRILLVIIGINLALSLVSGLTIDSVSSNPTEIKPGERVVVVLMIENNLDVDTEDVTVSLDLNNIPFAPYQSSNEVTYDDIKENREKEARYELIAEADAESGTYKIPVKITYTEEEENKENLGLISLIIKAEPRIKISVEDSILIKNQNTDLNLRIVNSGLGEARLLSLELNPGIGIKILGNNNIYIGDIESDDFDTADFQITISESAPSIVTLPVEISYRDSRNNEITENEDLKIRTYTEKQAISLGLIEKSNTRTIVVLIIVLIILYIIYRKLKKAIRKRKQDNKKEI